MSEKSKIAWTDSTLNFWEGCTKVSAGCANCYAEARDRRFTGGKLWGKGAPRRKSKSAVKDALRFNKLPWICDECGKSHPKQYVECLPCGSRSMHRRRIFSLSLGDWLDDEVPIEWFVEMMDTIRQCDQVTWILCTKRPENFKVRLNAVIDTDKFTSTTKWHWLIAWVAGIEVPPNIILLNSVENQEMADKRIPELLKIPAACHGLSLEPLLGPVDLSKWLGSNMADDGIEWAIIGGESGPNARPCNVEWIRSLVAQGKAADMATFVKQLGSNIDKNLPVQCPKCGCISNQEPGNDCIRGCDAKMIEQVFKDKKGGDKIEWPKDLQVQDWPKGF